jgi:hypothetical protein
MFIIITLFMLNVCVGYATSNYLRGDTSLLGFPFGCTSTSDLYTNFDADEFDISSNFYVDGIYLDTISKSNNSGGYDWVISSSASATNYHNYWKVSVIAHAKQGSEIQSYDDVEYLNY